MYNGRTNYLAQGYTAPTFGLGGYLELGAPDVGSVGDLSSIGDVAPASDADKWKRWAMYGGGALAGVAGVVLMFTRQRPRRRE